MPSNFLLCKKNRSSSNLFYCNACVSFEYKDRFIEMVYSNLMTTALGVESDILNIKDHTSVGASFLEKNIDIFSFAAIAINLNNILNKSNAPQIIDFFSLDVEGSEIEVLKGVNHSQYKFKYILIECRNFLKLQSYMSLIDYYFVEKLSEHDYLFSYENVVKS